MASKSWLQHKGTWGDAGYALLGIPVHLGVATVVWLLGSFVVFFKYGCIESRIHENYLHFSLTLTLLLTHFPLTLSSVFTHFL